MFKNKKLAGLVSLALLVGGVASSCSEIAPEEEEVVEEESVHDEEGVGIRFGKEAATVEDDVIDSNLGVQLTENDDGTYNVRFVARMTGYKGLRSAQFVRSVVDGDGATVKEEASFAVDTVYTSVKDADSIQWTDEVLEEGEEATVWNYYMVYTMRKIPEANIFDVINVSLEAVDYSSASIGGSQSANVQGIIGDISEGISYAQTTDEEAAGTWHVLKTSTGISRAVVPEHHISVEGYVATDLGIVVAVGDTTSSTGGFENCSYLSEVILPDTIETFNRWCFYGASSLKELTFPKNLTTIMSSCFSTSNTLETVNWEATNLSDFSGTFRQTIPVINISADVESLPSSSVFYSSSYTVERINYEGTTAEWNALIGSLDNGLNIDNVFCSDTEVASVNYHLGGGTVTYNGTTYEEDFSIERIIGKTAIDVGNPSLSGMHFNGWYTAEEGGELYDFTAEITGDLDLYAQYGALPAGNSFADPYVVDDVIDSATATTEVGMYDYYVKFTAPAADIYYFNVSDITINTDISTNSYTSYAKLHFYDADQNEYTYSSYSLSSDSKVQTRSSSSPWVYSMDLAEGEVIYISMNAAESSSNSYENYGTFTYSIYTRENDSVATAASYTKGDTQEVDFSNDYRHYKYYSYTAESNDTLLLTGSNIGSLWFRFNVYDSENLSSSLTYAGGTSETQSSLTVEEGHTYIIEAYTNSLSTDEKKIYFTISDAPQGASESNPLSLTVGGDAVDACTSAAFYRTYMSVNVETAGYYIISLGAGSSSRQKSIIIGEDTYTETGTSSGSGYWSSTTYGAWDQTVYLAAGTHVLNVGYVSSSSSTTSFSVSIAAAAAGAVIETALEDITDPSASLGEAQSVSASADGVYHKFSIATAGTYEFSFSSDAGASFSASLLDSSGSVITTSTGDNFHDEYEAGDYYWYVVSESAVNITMSEFAAPFANADFLGDYIGCRRGSSWYKMTINSEGYTWESSSTQYELSYAQDTADGVSYLEAPSSADYSCEIVTNGTDAFVYRDSYMFFMSKRCTNYSSSGVSGQGVSSNSFSYTSSGYSLMSILETETSNRIYMFIVDQTVYFDVSVEFSSGSAINSSGSIYEIKDSSGNSLGTFESTSSSVMAEYVADESAE